MIPPWVLLFHPGMSDVSAALLPMGNLGLPNDMSPVGVSRGLFQKPVTE